MKRSKQGKYKKHLEEGTTPPKSSKRLYIDIYNVNKDEDDTSSATNMNEQQKSCSLLKHQQSEYNVDTESDSQYIGEIDNNRLRINKENVNISKVDGENMAHMHEEHYKFSDDESYEEVVSMDIRLNDCAFYDEMETSFYDTNNIIFDEISENEEKFWQADNEEQFSEFEIYSDSSDFYKTINTQFVVSQGEMLYAMQKFVELYSLPISALEYQCKMMNSFVSEPIVPNSKYQIDKLFRSESSVQYHAVCPNCNVYVQQFSSVTNNIYCKKCQTNVPVRGVNGNYFVLLNIENDIKHMIEKNQEYYFTVLNNPERERTIFNDITDGTEYIKFIRSLPDFERTSYITCNFNSDGSPVFKSSNYSIWPIQIILNELPNNIRLNETITCALWFGKNKPLMSIFLKAFVNKIQEINVDGIQCNFSNDFQNVKIYPVCCCVDSIARAPMQGHIQFNGSYGCGWCYHPGVQVKHNERSVIKYPLLNTVPEERTALKSLKHMRTKLTTADTVFGIKDVSALIHLDCFDIVNGFVPDVMHCVFLGICRQFAHYWFNESGKPYSLKKAIPAIDKVLQKIKVPHQISRLSRLLKDRNYWNSREWENWLLYYSLPILGSMPRFEIFEQHWSLLVEAIYILMSQSISTTDLLRAENLLKNFVAKTEELYGARAMTYNVHQLLHITQSVVNWGPLWAHSGYSFESGNGKILRMIKAARGLLQQICRKLEYKRSTSLLEENILKQIEHSPVIEFVSRLEKRYTEKSVKMSENRYYGKPSFTDDEAIYLCNASRKHTNSYDRMTMGDVLFTSCKRISLRSQNCFAQTNYEFFIQIIEFIVDDYNDKEYTLCNIVCTTNVFNRYHQIKQISTIYDEEILIRTCDIKCIAVCIDINSIQYISPVPNKLHY